MTEKASFDNQENDLSSFYQELRREWDEYSQYERVKIIEMLVKQEGGDSKKKSLVYRKIARKLHQEERRIIALYRINQAPNEILELLRKEMIDLDTINTIQKILTRKDVKKNKLFERLKKLADEKNKKAEHITIPIFREVLQECILNGNKNWQTRMTLCRIKENWTKEGEALKEYQLIYIPKELLTDGEAKMFNVNIHPEEAFVAAEVRGIMRPSRVPLEAIEPFDFYKDQKGELYDKLARWGREKSRVDPIEKAETLNHLVALERKSNVTTENKAKGIVAENSNISEQQLNHYLLLLKLNESFQQRISQKTMSLQAGTELIEAREAHGTEIDFDEIEKKLLRKRVKIITQDIRRLVNKALKTNRSHQPISKNPDFRDQLS